MAKRASEFNQLTRGLKIAAMLGNGQSITTELIRKQFGVSKATATRDMVVIEQCLPVDAVIENSTKRVSLRMA